MTNKGIAYDNGHRCYIPEGRHKRFLGCTHTTPRQAIAHTVPVYVDPRRSPGGSHVAPVAPPRRDRGPAR